MRDVLHAFAMAAVIAIAALCTLIQLSDASRAFDQLGRDEQAVIQQVSSDSGSGGATSGKHQKSAHHRAGQGSGGR